MCICIGLSGPVGCSLKGRLQVSKKKTSGWERGLPVKAPNSEGVEGANEEGQQDREPLRGKSASERVSERVSEREGFRDFQRFFSEFFRGF